VSRSIGSQAQPDWRPAGLSVHILPLHPAVLHHLPAHGRKLRRFMIAHGIPDPRILCGLCRRRNGLCGGKRGWPNRFQQRAAVLEWCTNTAAQASGSRTDLVSAGV